MCPAVEAGSCSAAGLAEARVWVSRDLGWVLWAPCQARGIGMGSGGWAGVLLG